MEYYTECKKTTGEQFFKSGNSLFFLPAFEKQKAPTPYWNFLETTVSCLELLFHVLVLFKIIIAIKSNHTCEPLMCWETPNLVESLKFFKQQCGLFFPVKGITENKQVDHILLLLGKEGLRRYNSWSFGNDADRRNPAVIWEKFLEQIEPRVNFRIARFCLQNYSQKETENIDVFLARCRLQAQKC